MKASDLAVNSGSVNVGLSLDNNNIFGEAKYIHNIGNKLFIYNDGYIGYSPTGNKLNYGITSGIKLNF